MRTQIRKSNCDKIKKNKILTKIKTQIETKLNSNCDQFQTILL